MRSSVKYQVSSIKGFTLIELLVVVAIMSLLFSVGYVNFRNFQQRQVGQSLVRNIKSDLVLARENATSGAKPAGCDILNGYKFTITSTTQYSISATCTSSDIQTKVVDLQTGFTLNTPSPNPLIFKVLAVGTNIPNGGLYALTINQTALGTSLTIYVRPSGEIEEGAPGSTPAVTPTPTANPTGTPTSVPTPTSTANPTITPTSTPTAAPTVTPTPTPTKLPKGSVCKTGTDCQSGICSLGKCS